MEKKPLISVIVPVYNTEKFLEKCLESINNQTFKDFELIIINDGSTDSSLNICEAFAKQTDIKVTIKTTENQGQGLARNLGLSMAKGEYISFVDSDDSLEPKMFETMLKTAMEEESDIVVCDVRLFDEINNETEIQKSLNGGIYNVRNYIQYGINLCSPCNKLFKRKLIESFRFNSITYEDTALIPVVISKASKIKFLDKQYYNYYKRNSSTSFGDNNFIIDDFTTAIYESINNINEKYRDELVYWHARAIISLSNGNKKNYLDEFSHFVAKNRTLFENNSLIQEDYYVKKIFDMALSNKPNCNKLKYSCKYSIVTKECKDRQYDINYFKNEFQNKIQFIFVSELSELSLDVICGEFFFIFHDYEFLNKDFLRDLYTIVAINSKNYDIIGVPLTKNSNANETVDIIKDYANFEFANYTYGYRTQIFEEFADRIGNIIENSIYYALINANLIYIANQLSYDAKQPLSKSLIDSANALEILNDIKKSAVSYKLGIPSHLQFILMNYIKLIICEPSYVSVPKEVMNKSMVQSILGWIEDDVINTQKQLTPEHKLLFYKLKYGGAPTIIKNKEKIELVYNDRVIYSQNNTYTIFEFFKYDSGLLELEGRTICLNCDLDEEIIVYAQINNRIYTAEILERECSRYWEDELLFRGIEFKFSIPISEEVELYEIKFFYIYRGYVVSRNDIRFAKYFPLTKKLKSSYCKVGDRVLIYDANTKMLLFRLCGKKGKLLREIDFLKEVKEKYPYNYNEVRHLRIKYFIRSIFKNKKKIWLVSDKAFRSDDNGEAFFLFLNNEAKNPKIKSFYIIDKKSPHYKRIKKAGKVVQFQSIKHKWLSLCCEYQFAAYAHTSILNPLVKSNDFFKDILRKEKVVFLQHGITQNNLSNALNKYNQNFRAIITSNIDERNAFIEYPYHYKKEKIYLTGLPRYDKLHNSPKNYITIAPTWRRYIFGDFIQNEERYVLNEDYKNSSYYKFYHSLLNNKSFIECAKKYNYEIHLIPHPVLFPYGDIFESDNCIITHNEDVSYNEMYSASNLFVTDYSSAAFDFAYMKKPVFYMQFDREEFYGTQYNKGHFNYEEDGFGEVVFDLKSTVDLLINYIESGCKMKQKYMDRVDSFFAFHDNQNCKRIYNKIMEERD